MSMKIKKEIILDNLSYNKKHINWKTSVGHIAKFIYDDIQGKIKIVNCYRKNNKTYLKIEYKNNIYDIDTDSFKEGKLGKILGKCTNDFKIKIGQRFKDDKRDITIIDRKKKESPYKKGAMLKYYKYRCNKCGFECGEHYKNGKYQKEHWIVESSLLRGSGCACCNPISKITVPGINDISTTDPWMIKYFQGGYDEAKKFTIGSEQKIYPICPVCLRIKEKTIPINRIYKYHSINCNCSDGQSYPNKFCFALLTQLNIKFISEYAPDWIKPKRYDFYFKLNDKEYIVEMDGGWHNKDNNLSGQTKEESKVIDNYKDKLAKEHNIKVIRIDCGYNNLNRFNFVKNNILKSKLNNLFDLSKINWLKCEEFALSNLIKKACSYWNQGIHSTKEISKMMNLDITTIGKYLKKGVKINWCDYDPKKEHNKTLLKGGDNKKEVAVFKNRKLLEIFPSCAEIERQSEKLFGVKLSQDCISLVALGKKPQYKGFTFKYTENINNKNQQQKNFQEDNTKEIVNL